jgi:PTH1 family peptidyl-tRNA hydrolase
VGLGNPGSKYEGTRHNVGFDAVDRIARASGIAVRQRRAYSFVGVGRIGSTEAVLAKPQTYMNNSGRAAQSLLSHYHEDPSQLIVIHDDLDLELGCLRIKTRGGHGGHRGIQSILASLGTDRFVRVKIGIGRPAGEAEDHVLSAFSNKDRECLEETLSRIVEAVDLLVEDRTEKAMNRYH